MSSLLTLENPEKLGIILENIIFRIIKIEDSVAKLHERLDAIECKRPNIITIETQTDEVISSPQSDMSITDDSTPQYVMSTSESDKSDVAVSKMLYVMPTGPCGLPDIGMISDSKHEQQTIGGTPEQLEMLDQKHDSVEEDIQPFAKSKAYRCRRGINCIHKDLCILRGAKHKEMPCRNGVNKDGADCTFAVCMFTHPPSRRPNCHKPFNCMIDGCEYMHRDPCKFKNKCHSRNMTGACHYWHPTTNSTLGVSSDY